MRRHLEDKPPAPQEHRYCIYTDPKELNQIRPYAEMICAKQHNGQVQQVGNRGRQQVGGQYLCYGLGVPKSPKTIQCKTNR